MRVMVAVLTWQKLKYGMHACLRASSTCIDHFHHRTRPGSSSRLPEPILGVQEGTQPSPPAPRLQMEVPAPVPRACTRAVHTEGHTVHSSSNAGKYLASVSLGSRKCSTKRSVWGILPLRICFRISSTSLDHNSGKSCDCSHCSSRSAPCTAGMVL